MIKHTLLIILYLVNLNTITRTPYILIMITKPKKKEKIEKDHQGNKNFNSSYGTIEKDNPNTVFINVRSWITATDKINKPIVKEYNTIKRTVYNLIRDNINQDVFNRDKLIVVSDTVQTGAECKIGRREFIDIEVTLFRTNEFSLETALLQLPKYIDLITTTLENNDKFQYNISKKDK